jgi:bacterioferritin-associated ferredoxin
MTNPNPLQKYFRQPAIYIRLPSDGRYWPQGTLEMPANRELAVYPMTAMDEITNRTADGLFNGESVVKVIQSCIPGIKDAWCIPSVDLDTVLVSIRIASYGHEMEFESKCSHCGEDNNFALDLRAVLEQIVMPNYEETVKYGDLEIYFQPFNYRSVTDNSLEQFEDQKILQSLAEAELPEAEKMEILQGALYKLARLTMNALGDSISMIKAGDDIVDNKEHIKDFLQNADKKIYALVRDKVQSMRDQALLKPVTAQCASCNESYETPFTLDNANFFASGS